MAVFLLVAASSAQAQVPSGFQGKWSPDPGTCAPKTGDPWSPLVIERSRFYELEIGCEVGRAEPLPNAVRMDALCEVHAAPRSPAVVLMKRLSQDKISITYENLALVARTPFIYYRCTG